MLGRRDLLRALGTGAGAAAATAVPLCGTAVAESERGDDERKARYRATDHVKTYYRVNSYPKK